MTNKRKILIFALIICLFFSISSVFASDINQTDVTAEIQAIDGADEGAILESSDSNSTGDILSVDNSSDVLNSAEDDVLTKDMSNESSLSANYADVYFESITTRYNSGDYFYYGWDGYFSGYLKVYSDNSLFYSEYLSGYNQDYEFDLEDMSPGTYKAKLITNGVTLGTGKIVIKKSSSKIYVKSFKATAGSKFYCYAYVTDKFTGRDYDGGKVKFKINGKKYSANLKDGVAVAKIKIPSKAKKYICYASFSGGENVYGSSTKFKIIVKKEPKHKIISTSAKSYWITKKSGKYTVQTKIWKMTASYWGKFKYIDTTLYKNGKQVKNTKYYVKYKINGKWTGWEQYGTVSTAHHRYAVSYSIKSAKIMVKTYV